MDKRFVQVRFHFSLAVVVSTFYPIRPTRIWPDGLKSFDNDRQWIAEPKINEWRAPMLFRDGRVILFNSEGERMKRVDENVRRMLRRWAQFAPKQATIIDGGLVNYRTVAHKGIYYAFDVVAIEGEMVSKLTYDQRRKLLWKLLGKHRSSWLWLPEYVERSKLSFYRKCLKEELCEGVVLKHREGTYPLFTAPRKKYPLWMKCKKRESHCYME